MDEVQAFGPGFDPHCLREESRVCRRTPVTPELLPMVSVWQTGFSETLASWRKWLPQVQ